MVSRETRASSRQLMLALLQAAEVAADAQEGRERAWGVRSLAAAAVQRSEALRGVVVATGNDNLQTEPAAAAIAS